MPHVIERATTGRAKCRGCGAVIAKDTLRVGEAVPNLYADSDGAESTHWYHPTCAAFRRPEPFLVAVAESPGLLPDAEMLVAAAELGVRCHRLSRLDRTGRAPSARAACRACRSPIAKGAWRISLLFWQDGRFAAAGFIHVTCAEAYLGTPAILERLRHFTPDLTAADVEELTGLLAARP